MLEYVTRSEFGALEATINSLEVQTQTVLDNEGSYITEREMDAGLDLLSRTVGSSAAAVNKTVPRINKIQQTLNQLAIRFRSYASNEQALADSVYVLPGSGEKDAMANASGEPSALNPFILDDDTRLTDAREPTAHVTTHQLGGTDELSHDGLADVGFYNHIQLDSIVESLQLLAGIQSDSIASNEINISSASNEIDVLQNRDLDSIPDGLINAKTTIAEKARIVTETILDALTGATSPSAANTYMTADETSALYQVIGSYVTMAYLNQIDTNLIPDGSGLRDLGSATKPWRELFLSGNSIILGDITLSTIDGELAIDGQKVVRFDTVADEITVHPDVVVGKTHAEILHDWDYIRSQTVDNLPLATTMYNFVAHHATSTDHDSRYLIKNIDLAPINVALISQIEAGNYDIPWSSLTSVPELASANFKGTVPTFLSLPTTGNANGDVYVVQVNPDNSSLASLYLVVEQSSTNRDIRYRAIYNPSLITHNSMPGREASDAHPQYMTETDVGDYLAQPGVYESIKLDIGISGTGSLFSSLLQTRLDRSYNHANEVGNPHNTTAEDTGAIRDQNGIIKSYHLSVGTGINQLNSDDLVAAGFEGTDYKFKTTQDVADLSLAKAHAQDASVHLSASEVNQLTLGADNTLHYHADDRDLDNSTGNLDARTRLGFLEEAVGALPSIQQLELYIHNEHHDLADHSDTNTTGLQLDELVTNHNTFSSAHNKAFTTQGGDNGTSTEVARGNHKHDSRYLRLTDYTKLALPGSPQTVDWTNLINIPQTVGNTRVVANLSALAATTPLSLGEQVIVTDYNGSNQWGVYIATGTSVGEFSLISAEDMGILYAGVSHDHDADYMPLDGAGMTGAVESVINNFFGTPHANLNIPTDAEQTAWDFHINTTFPQHAADTDLHMSAGTLSDITANTDHRGVAHLSPAEVTSLTTALPTTIFGSSYAVSGNTRTLESHLEIALAAVSDITDIPGWPTGETSQTFTDLFSHDHDIQYSALGHTHTANQITDLDAAIGTGVGGLGYFKEADVNTWLSGKTTTDLAEGVNKYLTLGNLRDISAFTNLEDHAANVIGDSKHLTDGQYNALTSGLASRTDLHSHEGYHYRQDGSIQIGLTRTSITNPATVGTAGMIGTESFKVTGGAPANNAVSGQEGEIRIGSGSIFIYSSGSWYESPLSLMA